MEITRREAIIGGISSLAAFSSDASIVKGICGGKVLFSGSNGEAEEDWVAHRDAVMEYALQLINDVQQGLRPPPTMDEFKAGLSVIHWSVE